MLSLGVQKILFPADDFHFLLLAYQLKIPLAQNHELHYTTVMSCIQDSVVGTVTMIWGGQPRNLYSTPGKGKIFLSSAQHPGQPWGPSSLLFNVDPPPIRHIHGEDSTATVYRVAKYFSQRMVTVYTANLLVALFPLIPNSIINY